MRKKLFVSAESFFKDYVGCEIKYGSKAPKTNTLVSHIEITNAKEKLDIYFKATSSLTGKIAEVYMLEKLENQDLIEDFFCELSNIIAGMAKVEMEGNAESVEYHLSTPKLVEKIPRLSSSKVYKLFNKCFMVGIR